MYYRTAMWLKLIVRFGNSVHKNLLLPWLLLNWRWNLAGLREISREWIAQFHVLLWNLCRHASKSLPGVGSNAPESTYITCYFFAANLAETYYYLGAFHLPWVNSLEHAGPGTLPRLFRVNSFMHAWIITLKNFSKKNHDFTMTWLLFLGVVPLALNKLFDASWLP